MIEIINDSDKTFIGRIEKGLNFLGYHFSPEGFSMAEKTIEKFLARAVQLYEQEQEEPFGSPLLGPYVRRWDRWVRSMSVEHVGIDLFFKRSSYRVDLEPADIFDAECPLKMQSPHC